MYITFIGHFRNTSKYDSFEKLLHLSSEKQEHHRSFPKTSMCVCVCLCTHVPFCCLSEQKHGLIQRWYFSSHLWKRVSKKKTRYKVLETLSSMDGLGGQILLLFPPSVETSEKEKPLLPKSGYSFSYISMSFSAKWTGYKKKELSLPLCFHLHVDVYLYHINQRRFR